MSDSSGNSNPEQPDPGQGSGTPNYPPPPQPYGQPAYGQQPYGYQQAPAYQPYQPSGASNGDRRPGTVTAAGIITLVFSGLVLALFAIIGIVMVAAKDEMVRRMQDEPTLRDISPNDVVAVVGVICLIFAVWCIIAMVLAVFTLRRSNGARIGLVISSALVAVLSLLGITSGGSALTLVASVAVIVLLFVGGASDWFARRDPGAAYSPGGMPPPVA